MYKVPMFLLFYQSYLSLSAVFRVRRQTNERNLMSGKFPQMARGVMDCQLSHGGGMKCGKYGKFPSRLNFVQTFVPFGIAFKPSAFCVFRKTFKAGRLKRLRHDFLVTSLKAIPHQVQTPRNRIHPHEICSFAICLAH